MLALTVELLESDADAARTVQAQKSWISVDEYQDTNPLQERLLELWIGESVDLAVVGDPDQTIYTFTGATPDTSTAERAWPSPLEPRASDWINPQVPLVEVDRRAQ